MEYIVIGFSALLASGLTLFAGFGLGTILVPVFALFFPLDMAILLTAIVHFLNNVFKFLLLGKHANWQVIARFGVPAVIFAYLGAEVLRHIEDLPSITNYLLNNHVYEITWVKVIIGILLIVFAILEMAPATKKLQANRKYLPLGGVLSGFFGGLSGHQGALRSLFLLRSGLSKEGFIATGVVIACLVDISRMASYIPQVMQERYGLNYPLLITASGCAFAGAWIGNKLLKKITIRFLQIMVSILLMLFGMVLMVGLV